MERCRNPGDGGRGGERVDPEWHIWWMSRRKLDPRLMVILIVVHTVVATLTWRDISHRDQSQIRGRKWVWRLASTVQMGNSLAYWLFASKSADVSVDL